jgi:hypothetical protein
VRDRHRPAAGDLPPEEREDAAGRVDDVPEANRRVARAAGRRDDPLGDGFRLPEDARRLDRFVGREEHEPLHARRARRRDHVPRREDARRHALDRVRLEQRHLLVRGRVEDHVGPMPVDHVESPLRAPEIGEDRLDVHASVVIEESGRQLDERRLGVVDEHERAGAESRQPRSELRADRARGAAYEDRRAGDVVRELMVSDLNRRATQQCFDRAVRRGQIRFTRDSDYETPFRGNVQALSSARASAATTRS